MKIYEFSYPNEVKDWVFAPNIKEAKEFYLSHSGCGDLECATIKRIPKSEWNNLYLIDPNESEPDEDEEDYNEDDYLNGYKIVETFADYAKRNKSTDIICTTEF